MSVAHERAKKAALVVMGGEHSGSSILCKLSSSLGFRNAIPATAGPPTTVNVPGEADDIARLNRAIIQELDSAWDRPAVFVARGRPPSESAIEVDALVTRRYLGEAAAALDTSFGDATRVVISDPLVALFPGLWDAALRQCGFAARRVLIVRNPIETADWLHQHRGLGRPRGIQLWLRYTMSALTLPAGRPDAIIRLDQLRRDKASLVFRLLDQLGLRAADAETHHPALDQMINDELREDLLPPEFLYRRPLISALVKDVYRLCVGWGDIEPQARDDVVSALATRFEEFCLCASSFAAVPATLLEASGTPAPTAATQPTVITGGNAGRAEQKRTVIVHYHLFKNAGTSVDAILRKNFGDGWAAREYVKQSRPEMAASVRAFLLEHPEIKALASHTLLLPPPELPGVEVFPVIFVRHPLDRMKSAYTFEREQNADTYGARLAKQTDFAGYVRAHLENPADRVCRNFHTARLSMMEPPRNGTELERALRAFDALPFIGAVEAFGASMQRLQTLLTPRIPNFRIFEASENVSRPRRTLDDRIAEIRTELGDELFDTLAAANADDFVLHRLALGQYADETHSPATESSDGDGLVQFTRYYENFDQPARHSR